MNDSLLNNWQRSTEQLQLGNCDTTYKKLVRKWNGFGRHYHTLQHLRSCLNELHDLDTDSAVSANLSIALWFHDAIYNTFRFDNEQRSAEWAKRFLTEHGATEHVANHIFSLIMATRHASTPESSEAALLVDIDLSILGSAESEYELFEANVRKEYWWVPKRRFAAARSKILSAFLQNNSIYYTAHFRSQYEDTARINLQRALIKLSVDLEQ